MNDRFFLIWLHERLEHIHGENPMTDYMGKLRSIIAVTPSEQATPNTAPDLPTPTKDEGVTVSLHNEISNILNRFNFDEVHRVMVFLDWQWANTASGYAVPTVEELKSCANTLLWEACNDFERRGKPLNGSYVSTGGFMASVEVFDSGRPELRLLFNVTQSRSHLG